MHCPDILNLLSILNYNVFNASDNYSGNSGYIIFCRKEATPRGSTSGPDQVRSTVIR